MKRFLPYLLLVIFPMLSEAQIFNPIDTQICKGGNTSFRSGSIYPAPSYRWQIKHKGGPWTDLNNGAPFSGVTATILRLTNISDTFDKDSFKCKVYFNSNLVGISNAARLTVFGGSTLPTSVFASVNPVNCPGGSTQLSHTGGTLSSGSSWRWYAGSCGQNPVSNPAKPNVTTTYYLRAEGPCKDTTACSSVTVVVNNNGSTPPNTILASNDTLCNGDSSVLSLSGGSLGIGAKWKWYTGSTCSVILDTSGVSSITVKPLSSAAFSVKADGGCGPTICKSISIQVYQLPLVNAGNDTAICKGSVISLKPIVKGKNKYTWFPSTGLNDSTVLSPNASPLLSTTFTLTVNDSHNCVKSDAVQIIVNPNPIAIAGTDTALCKGASVGLNASGGNFFKWFPSIGLDNANISSPLATPLQTTTYSVQVTDQYKCSDTAEVDVTVHLQPQITINNDTAICAGNSVKLHADGGISYKWSPAIGLDNDQNSEPNAQPAVSTTYSVLVSNAFGCSSSDSVRILIKPLPIVQAGSDKEICIGDTIQLQTNSGNGYVYSWKPAVALLNPFSATTLAFPDTGTEYIIEVDLNACMKSDTVRISVLNSPRPEFSSFDSIVCKNSYWSMYCVQATSHSFKWIVEHGSIMSGQGENCIYVHWSPMATSGKVILIDSLKSLPACPVKLEFDVSIRSGSAPQPVTVKAKNNSLSTGILYCENGSFAFYEWGFEHKFSRYEQYASSGDSACFFSLSMDTANYYYWVKVGDDPSCLTKSYFNAPPFSGIFSYKKVLTFIYLYPNPVADLLHIECNSIIRKVFITDILGKVKTFELSEMMQDQTAISMSSFESGFYVISVLTDEGMINRKLVKQ